MVTPAGGAVVPVPFPFSDFVPSQVKLRPAVVLADGGRGDWIVEAVVDQLLIILSNEVWGGRRCREENKAQIIPPAREKIMPKSDPARPAPEKSRAEAECGMCELL